MLSAMPGRSLFVLQPRIHNAGEQHYWMTPCRDKYIEIREALGHDAIPPEKREAFWSGCTNLTRNQLLSSAPLHPSSPAPKRSAPSSSPTAPQPHTRPAPRGGAPHLSRRHRRRPPSCRLRDGETSGHGPAAARPASLMPRCLRPWPTQRLPPCPAPPARPAPEGRAVRMGGSGVRR